MQIHVKLTLIEEMLGTKAANPNVFADFIASKHPSGTPQADELENAKHCEEAGTTVFHREDGRIGIYDYQIKGFFKDACGSLRMADDSLSKRLTAYKTKIDGLFHVAPRFIPIQFPDGGAIGVCERPLRADTAQGPRVALARSETLPAGSIIEFDLTILAKKLGKGDDAINTPDLVTEWFDYGKFRGLGQWRNSGKGRFTFESVP